MVRQNLQRVIHRFIVIAHLRIPFTEANKVFCHIDKKAKNILDVACEKGSNMRFITDDGRFYSIGADILEPYLQGCKRERIHNEYVKCDVRSLPFARKSIDVVLCLELIEHLEKAEATRLIADLESIACKQVILSTPIGIHEQGALDENPHQIHISAWSPVELQKMGYKVRGHGWKYWDKVEVNIPKTFRPLAHVVVKMLVSPLSYFLPTLGNDLVCVKEV